MHTVREKRKNNIAEYLLYMWALEDMARAAGLDAQKLIAMLGPVPKTSPAQMAELQQWYEGIVEMMRAENITQSGHLQVNINTLIDLTDLHSRLLGSPEHASYQALFAQTYPLIEEFRRRIPTPVSEIEACFVALYWQMLARLQHREISAETSEAFAQFGLFISTLSTYFHQRESGELEI